MFRHEWRTHNWRSRNWNRGRCSRLVPRQPRHCAQDRASSQPAKEKAKASSSDDSLGYTAHFQRELVQIGQISPQEFARRYPGQANYVDKFGWDPTTAKFWDEFNRDPSKLRRKLAAGRFPPE